MIKIQTDQRKQMSTETSEGFEGSEGEIRQACGSVGERSQASQFLVFNGFSCLKHSASTGNDGNSAGDAEREVRTPALIQISSPTYCATSGRPSLWPQLLHLHNDGFRLDGV